MFRILVMALFFGLNAYASIGPNWMPLGEQNGISAYKTEVPGTKVVGFRGETMVYASAEKVMHVLLDNDHRKDWVDRLSVSKVLEQTSPFEYVIYQEFNLPWPMKNRDFVYRGKAERDEQGRVILTLKSEEYKNAPKTTGVRAELKESRYIITPIGKFKSKLEVEILSDPKGGIPSWLVNLIQKNWPTKTLSAIKAQVEKSFVAEAPLPTKI